LHFGRRRDLAVEIELQRDAGRAEREEEVISLTPAMRPSCRSSGVATVAAMAWGWPREAAR